MIEETNHEDMTPISDVVTANMLVAMIQSRLLEHEELGDLPIVISVSGQSTVLPIMGVCELTGTGHDAKVRRILTIEIDVNAMIHL